MTSHNGNIGFAELPVIHFGADHFDRLLFETACTEWGAFYVPYGNINPNPVFQTMQAYFAQPMEIKLRDKISSTLKSQVEGYRKGPRIGYGVPNVCKKGQQQRETKETYSYVTGYGQEVYDQYCIQLSTLAAEIQRHVDASLQINRSVHKCHESLSLVHYLTSTAYSSSSEMCNSHIVSDNSIGLGAHTDWGYLTVLATDAPGLQIFQRHTDTWLDVAPRMHHFLVHLGDVVEHESNRKYTSPLHRVVSQSSPGHAPRKQSVVYFYEPQLDTHIHGTSATYEQFLQAKLVSPR